VAALDLAAHGLVAPATRRAIPGSPQSVAALLQPALREAPQREALVGRHARYSYAELDREVDRAARALAGSGIGPGDRVAASLGNHTELVVAFLAAMRIGAIWVGVSRALAPREKAFLLADSAARLFLGDAEACALVEARRAELPALERVIEARPGNASCPWRALVADAGGALPLRPEVDPFAPAAIAYTSGTTGLPKGAVHSQHNLLLPGAIAFFRERSGPPVTQGVCLPLTLLNLMILGPVLSAQAGSKCVLMDRLDAPAVAAWVRDERIVSFSSVPTTFHDLLTHPDVKPEDLATLTQPGVGGASCPDELKALFRARFGQEVHEGYGLTEAPTSVCHTDPRRPRIPRSVGRAHPHLEITIEDETGRTLGPGAVGEICVGPARTGPWAGVYTPMLGYWNRPEASAEALRGGRLHTGDLGHLDAEGNLFVDDRKADMIVRGGANVYSAEVERVLHEDPRVAACAVVGVPDRRLGERVMAAVQLVPGARADEDGLRRRCLASLARYKVPERIAFVEAFPRNAMNKIVKRELRGLFAGPDHQPL